MNLSTKKHDPGTEFGQEADHLEPAQLVARREELGHISLRRIARVQLKHRPVALVLNLDESLVIVLERGENALADPVMAVLDLRCSSYRVDQVIAMSVSQLHVPLRRV